MDWREDARVDEHRTAWSAAGGVVTTLFGSGAFAWWLASASADSELPQWPAYAFGAVALVGLYCVFAPLLRWWPFGRPTPAPAPVLEAQAPDPDQASLSVTPQTHERPEVREAGGEQTFLPEEVTPAYLVDLFQGKTDIQAENVAAPYLGKWMTVAGALGNVLTGRETIAQVTFPKGSIFDPDHEFFDTYMYFERPKWGERLAVLPQGAQIVVRGRLQRVNRGEVHLEKCELVAARGSP